MGERLLVQPPGLPRFSEDSAFKKHWPLFWLSALAALIVASFVTDFNNLGRIFENHGSGKLRFETQYIFPKGDHMLSYARPIAGGRKEHETIDQRRKEWLSSGERMANTITYAGCGDDGDTDVAFARAEESRTFLKWLFHRRLGLYFALNQDYEAAHSEFATALDFADELGKKYPSRAMTLSEMALLAELRAVEMQQVAQLLLRAVLPIFSFLAALLPFALFLIFMKSRDKVESSGGEAEKAGVRLFLKTMLLASWFGVIVTGWVALRNYGMGLAVGLLDPAAGAFFCTLGALLFFCCLMLRYMPPYKSLSLKRTMLGFGFGGVLLLCKALAIYVGLSLSLASHPALKDVLFCEKLYLGKAAEARSFAHQARVCAKDTLADRPFFQDDVLKQMAQITARSKTAEIEEKRAEQIRGQLQARIDNDVAMPNNTKVPYLWTTKCQSILPPAFMHQPVSVQSLTVAMTIKACLAYLLFFYPEFLAYIWLGFRQKELALKTFNLAVRVKEYFLGVDHWLVVGMLELFGSCLLTLHRYVDLCSVAEDYLRQAIVRYERSRGRHDQLTIAAKMSLAHFYSERGDHMQAERTLVEALRDVGKDIDTLAYCDLLSEIGKLYCRRNNYSRAKQMYKQLIELLELKLAKCPPSRGWTRYFHNIYATIPTWQLELKLVLAYLDLAEVFSLAKCRGEAQRLTEDANKRIGAFERDVVVVNDIAGAYTRARLAMAKMLCDQGRYDECFKILASARNQLYKWGWARTAVFVQFIVGECTLGLAARKANAKYYEDARKVYRVQDLRLHVPSHYGCSIELKERWQKLGEEFGFNPPEVAGNVYMAGPFAAGQAEWQSQSWSRSQSQVQPQPQFKPQSQMHSQAQVSTRSFNTLPRASTLQAQTEGSAGLSSRLPDNAAEPVAPSVTRAAVSQSSCLAAVTAAAPLGATPSRVIRESQERQEEGIVIRWQRERKQEVMLELRPERG